VNFVGQNRVYISADGFTDAKKSHIYGYNQISAKPNITM